MLNKLYKILKQNFPSIYLMQKAADDEIQAQSIASQMDEQKNRRSKRNADSELPKKVLVEVLE